MSNLVFYLNENIVICNREKNGKEEHVASFKFDNKIGSIYKGVVTKSFSKLGYCFVDIGIGEETFCSEKLSSGYSGYFIVIKNSKLNKPAEVSSKVFLMNEFFKFQPGIITRFSHNILDSDTSHILSIVPKEGFVIRSKSLKLSDEEIQKECNSLLAEWSKIKEKAAEIGKTGIVGIPLDPFLAIIDQENTTSIQTNSREISEKYSQIKYTDELKPIRFDRVVSLENGGQVVVDKTEAMWVFDVNSNNAIKDSNSSNVDETNIFAAKRIASILKERCITGQVIIDFINSKKSKGTELMEIMKELTLGDSVQQNSFVMLPSFVMYLTRRENIPEVKGYQKK